MSSFLDWIKKSFLIAVLVEIGVYGDKHSTYILLIALFYYNTKGFNQGVNIGSKLPLFIDF